MDFRDLFGDAMGPGVQKAKIGAAFSLPGDGKVILSQAGGGLNPGDVDT